MDNIEKTATIIKEINNFRNGTLREYDLINHICSYFDDVKNENLTQANLQFMNYISNIVGIPHYYDLLSSFKNTELKMTDLALNTISSLIRESTLYTTEFNKLHKFQKKVYDLFNSRANNRYILSASTSFGKTFLVYEIIKKMKYKNVVMVFPTIALLAENLERILSNKEYQYFKDEYSIHTLSEDIVSGNQNLFIFTPERFLSFIDTNNMALDFVFVDEVYKIDNEYIIDLTVQENERDIAYRIALYHIVNKSKDILLAGPYMDISRSDSTNYNPSFSNFLDDNRIQPIDYNDCEIVNKKYINIKNRKHYEIDNIDINFNVDDTSKKARLVRIVDKIVEIDENCIIYCSRKASTEKYAKVLIAQQLSQNSTYSKNPLLNSLINHIESEYDKKWIVLQALKNRIGIHHGLVPKYIQKEIINLFNKQVLNVLLSTTTITEGVNTTAKNLIVLDDKKGIKPLKKFDAKNISGRAGRFQKHYSGRIIAINNDFINIVDSKSEGLKHKNYDTGSIKDDIDLFITDKKYLNQTNNNEIMQIKSAQDERNIPDNIISIYKVVSHKDKIKVYDAVKTLDEYARTSIRNLIQKLNYPTMTIDYDGFQVLLDIISPIVRNKNLKFLIEQKSTSNDDSMKYSVLTHLVYFYLKDGFKGLVKYQMEKRNKNIDEAIRIVAGFVYNTLKYQLVKYLGVFNVMYKFTKSKLENTKYDDVSGIDGLLMKLEYNAISNYGRLASDYGVPAKIIDYYDNADDPNKSRAIQSKFDEYEKVVYDRTKILFNSKE